MLILPKGITFTPKDHVYYYGQKKLPSVTQIMKGSGQNEYDRVPKRILEKAAHRGNLVHDAVSKSILSDDMGAIAVTDVEVAKEQVALYNQFMTFGILEPMYSEVMFYHPELWYAGTVDIIGKVNGKWALVDIKCTAKYMKESCELQTAGYGIMIGFWNPDRDFDRFVLHLDRNSGMPKLQPMRKPDRDDRNFLALVEKHANLDRD